MDPEQLLSYSPIESHEHFEARETLDELRKREYVISHGVRGLELNNSAFGALANVLYYECGWESSEIKLRLKHYEGWETNDWS